MAGASPSYHRERDGVHEKKRKNTMLIKQGIDAQFKKANENKFGTSLL